MWCDDRRVCVIVMRTGDDEAQEEEPILPSLALPSP